MYVYYDNFHFLSTVVTGMPAETEFFTRPAEVTEVTGLMETTQQVIGQSG